MKKQMLWLIVLVSLLMFPISAAAEGYDLRIATGGPNGTYYQIGLNIQTLAAEHGIAVEVLNSKGSISNYQLLDSRGTDLAIMQSDAMGFIKGQDAHAPEKLRIFMQLYNEELHFLASRAINSISDLQRKRIVIGSFGSGTYVTANQVLQRYFVGDAKKIFDISYADAIKQLLVGDIDAMAYVAGKPTALFKKLEVIADDPDMGKLLKRLHFIPITKTTCLAKYYVASTIGPSDYSWVESESPTIAPKAVIAYFHDLGSKSGCEEKRKNIKKLYNFIKTNIDKLRATGHQKWKEVDVDAPPLKGWKVDQSLRHNVTLKKIDSLFD